MTIERVTPDRVGSLARLLEGRPAPGLAGAAWADTAVAGLAWRTA